MSLESRKLSVDVLCCLAVAGVCKFLGGKGPKVTIGDVISDLRFPAVHNLAPRDAFVTRCIARFELLIADILSSGREAKIGELVVRSVAVDMVNINLGPHPMNDDPYQSMGRVLSSVDLDNQMPVLIERTGCFSKCPEMRRKHQGVTLPSEETAILVVAENLAKEFCRQVGLGGVLGHKGLCVGEAACL